jgi:hypothetical protein
LELCSPEQEEFLHLERGPKRIGDRLASGKGEYGPDLTVHLRDEVTARGNLPLRQGSEPLDRGFVGSIGEP